MDGSTPPMSELYEVIERMIRERAQIEQLQAARHSPLVGRGSFSSSRVYEADGDALGRLFPLDGASSSLSINWDSVTGTNAWMRRPQFPMSLLNELSDTRHGLMSVAWSENDVMSRGVLSRYQIRHLDNGLPVVPTTNQHKIWDDVLHVFYRFPHEARECLYDRTRIGNTDGLPLSDAGVAKCWTRSLVLRQRTSLAEVCAEVMAQQDEETIPGVVLYQAWRGYGIDVVVTLNPRQAKMLATCKEGAQQRTQVWLANLIHASPQLQDIVAAWQPEVTFHTRRCESRGLSGSDVRFTAGQDELHFEHTYSVRHVFDKAVLLCSVVTLTIHGKIGAHINSNLLADMDGKISCPEDLHAKMGGLNSQNNRRHT